jgi:hydroxyacylglutathione hydrolase
MLDIDIISCLQDNYSYLLREKITGIVAIVDPSDFNSCNDVIEKKYKKLDFILNTHHHLDHVGGNLELKKKYGSKVLGFVKDKNRIPGINITLNENQNIMIGSVMFKVIAVPGHTSGHIAFYSEEEKVVFTGDTLFSLGCGRVFEGTYEQMINSLNKLKNLPDDTSIYCGHEYTKKNYEFCFKFEPNNENLKVKKNWIDLKLKLHSPTVPITIGEELKTNIFLRCDKQSIKDTLNLNYSSEKEIFAKLRDLKDNF